jgi:hypothetical protein
VPNQDAAAACKSSPSIFWSSGHGTAVASLLTGNITGAARPEIVSVNIYECVSGNATRAAYATAALNWIKGDVQARKASSQFKPSIVNHSGYVYPWDSESGVVMEAVRQVVGENVPYFTSADNFSGDSCAFTPNMYAYTPNSRHWTRVVFAVGGTTMNGGVVDHRMTGTLDVSWKLDPSTYASGVPTRVRDTGTNLGACVSAFAPAVHVHAAWHGTPSSAAPNKDAYRLQGSGTSWSSPLAAALALRWMSAETAARGGTIPYYWEAYDFLLDGTKASVTVQANAAYTICYDPGDVNNWEYFANANHTCSPAITYPASCDPTHPNYNPANLECKRTQPYRMPATSNTSAARMINY